MKRITQIQVLTAIKKSGGLISTIATRLNCSWNTARTYCYKWESTKQALQDETETILDVAEQVIIKAIKKGDVNACKWYLSTKGKERGFTTDTKADLQPDKPEPLEIIITDADGNKII